MKLAPSFCWLPCPLQDDKFVWHVNGVFENDSSSLSCVADLLLPTGYLVLEKFHGYDVTNSAWGKPWEERADLAYFVGRMTGEPLPNLEGIHVVNPRLRAAEIATER